MPLAPPVIKIVLLLSFIIKYPPNYVTIYKSHSTSTRRLRRLMGAGRVGDYVHARCLDPLGSKGLHPIAAPGALQSMTPCFPPAATVNFALAPRDSLRTPLSPITPPSLH